jgi:hypothetical protein
MNRGTIAGIIIAALPLVALYIVMGLAIGFREASMIWGGVLAGVGCVLIGTHLIVNSRV